MRPINDITEPSVHIADRSGRAMAAIYIEDLDRWAEVVDPVERWLSHASEATRADYARFVADRLEPGEAPALGDLAWMLSAMVVRMRTLVSEVGS